MPLPPPLPPPPYVAPTEVVADEAVPDAATAVAAPAGVPTASVAKPTNPSTATIRAVFALIRPDIVVCIPLPFPENSCRRLRIVGARP
ncbi:hypothetical protein B7R25_04075 [Subtercola boreus]|uniref:Uncharacterized protein n=1 Tax=Subtercola boreus TaxID=120213 RepID=A0A3E0WGG4_9MICO|nr:hypothetical protein B7R24_04065 [Subtercola boreus]RFA23140.1 hypothetical protein B7R23_04060 [Subtercola boreus]RFA28893.1 hypothetical protein B7R25_04075 [Subtercola boreus]